MSLNILGVLMRSERSPHAACLRAFYALFTDNPRAANSVYDEVQALLEGSS